MANDVIQVNYETLARIERDFTRAAEESSRMQQRLKTTADRLVGARWEGEAARKFFAEMEEVILPAFDRLTKALYGCQDVTEDLVRQFRQAEEEAAALFKKDDETATHGSAGNGTAGAATGGAAGGATGTETSGAAGRLAGSTMGGATGEYVSNSDYHWLQQAKTMFGQAFDVASKAYEGIRKVLGHEGLPDELTLGVGVLADEDFPSNIPRAIAGELGKFGVDKLVEGAATAGIVAIFGLSIPEAAALVAVAGATLAAAPYLYHLAAEANRLLGNKALADQYENAEQFLDSIDYGKYVEKASESIFDSTSKDTQQAAGWLQTQVSDYATAF